MAEEKIILQVDIDSSQTEKNITGLTDSIIELKKAQIDLNKQVKAGEISEAEHQKELEKSKEDISKLNSERKNEIKILKAAENSIEALEAANAKLVKQRKQLNLSTAEGIARYKELTAQIKVNQERLNAYNEDIGRHQGNVGNYAGAIKNVVGKFAAIGAAVAGAAGAFAFFTDAMRKSAAGAENFEYISGRLQTAFDKIQSKAGEAANYIAKILLTSAELYGLITESDKELGKAQGDLNVSLREQALINSKIQKQIAELNVEYEKQTAIAGDATIGFEKQKQAEKLANEASLKILELRLQMADKNVQFAEKQLKINEENLQDTYAQEIKLNEALIERIEIQKQIETQKLNNAARIRQIELDLFEQQLDFNLDIYNSNKNIIQRQLTEEKLSVEKRLELVEQLKKGTEENYKKNIKLINTQLKTKLDANELEKISDEQKLLRIFYEAGAAGVVANRAREVVMENITFKQDVADEEKRLLDQHIKDLGIATAIEIDYIKSISDIRQKESDKQNDILSNDLLIRQANIQRAIDDTTRLKDENEKVFNSIVSFADRTGEVMVNAAMETDATIQSVLAATAEAIIQEVEAFATAQLIKLILKQTADAASLNIPGAIAAGAGIVAIKAASAGIRAQIKSSVAPSAPANIPQVSTSSNLSTVNRQFASQPQINVAAPNVNVSTSAPSANEIGNAVAKAVHNIPIYVDVTQINEAQGLKAKVTNNGRI